MQSAHRYISLTAKGKRIRDMQIIQRAARPNRTWAGKTQSAGQAETPPQRAETLTRWAETLTLEGANQGIKESGHRSRRPPAH